MIRINLWIKQEAIMSRVSPFHTDSEEYPPEHRKVYHDDSDCPEGKRIENKHRKTGTDGKTLCKECAKLH